MAPPRQSEMVAAPAGGRIFQARVRPGFADCSPSGRTRLDCVARWLQDVAYEDVEEAGLAAEAVWVLRRTRIQVNRWPRHGERFEASTFCSGLGRMWAERRTSIRALGGVASDVEAVALWVHLDLESWRPLPLSDRELAAYGGSADGRRVTARLRHPPPQPPYDRASPWVFRATDLDIASHVNNSAYWLPLEDELCQGPEPGQIDVEIEFRTPAGAGEKLVIGDGRPLRPGAMRWIAEGDGAIHASILVAGLGS